MSDNEEINQHINLLYIHRRTVRHLLGIAAQYGGESSAPVSIHNQLIETRSEIRRSKVFLHSKGVAFEESPNDEPPSATTYVLRAAGGGESADRRGATPVRKRFVGARQDPAAIWAALLRELMETDPSVREAAIICHDRFQVAREHLHELLVYKSLHDYLQELQISCYITIKEEAKRFPDGDQSIDNLKGYCHKLNDIVTGMQRAVKDVPTIRTATSCIDKLSHIYTDVLRSISDKDIKPLKEAIFHIKHVLELHMGPINTELKNAARAMRLHELVQSLIFIQEVMREQDIDSEQVNQLAAWIGTLAEQNQFLMALVTDHDQWQNVEHRLRLIEGSLDQDLLGLVWPELREEATQLYGASEEEWAIELKSYDEQIERSLAPLDLHSFMSCFGRYRRSALHRFYDVDKQLLEQCRSFARFDGPLAFVSVILP